MKFPSNRSFILIIYSYPVRPTSRCNSTNSFSMISRHPSRPSSLAERKNSVPLMSQWPQLTSAILGGHLPRPRTTYPSTRSILLRSPLRLQPATLLLPWMSFTLSSTILLSVTKTVRGSLGMENHREAGWIKSRFLTLLPMSSRHLRHFLLLWSRSHTL